MLLAACGSKSNSTEPSPTIGTVVSTTIDPASVVADVSAELQSLDEDLAAIDAATSDLITTTTTAGGN